MIIIESAIIIRTELDMTEVDMTEVTLMTDVTVVTEVTIVIGVVILLIIHTKHAIIGVVAMMKMLIAVAIVHIFQYPNKMSQN